MTTSRRIHSRRRLDVASLILTLVGLAFSALAFWLVSAERVNALIVIPAIVAVTIGATHLVKYEAPRE